jgi:XTP/dITP diphosphohydrolase
LGDIGEVPDPAEDAPTFSGNAAIKAKHYSRHCGVVALADDSGLEVDALGGGPGVRSARFAGEPADDRANNAKLIDALRHVAPKLRTARFRCAVALADGDDLLATAEGVVEGLIVDQPRGENGFGYDPHFWLPDRGQTTAELSPTEKNEISHRGRALRAMRARMAALTGRG